MVDGYGFCLDREGKEVRSRSYRNGYCEENCTDDDTCPGFAYNPETNNCVWYTDHNPMQLGQYRAQDFTIIQSGHYDQEEWLKAKCFVKYSNSQNKTEYDLKTIGSKVLDSYDNREEDVYRLFNIFETRGNFKYSVCGYEFCKKEVESIEEEEKIYKQNRIKEFERKEELLRENVAKRNSYVRREL
eukprot:UN31021